MSLSTTHIVFHADQDKVLLFQPCSNPDKGKGLDRTNEFIHTMLGYLLTQGPRTITLPNGDQYFVSAVKTEQENNTIAGWSEKKSNTDEVKSDDPAT
jgi:hypothetical protein